MVYPEIIEGNIVSLRAVNEDDASFILSLRCDKKISRYLNPTEFDLDKQREWIRLQRIREGDYYFVVYLKKTNEPVGLISIYDIKDKEGLLGRWICPFSPLHALESVLLVYDFSFYTLGLDLVYTLCVLENEPVSRFHDNLGATRLPCIVSIENSKFKFVRQEIAKSDYGIIQLKNKKIIDNFL